MFPSQTNSNATEVKLEPDIVYCWNLSNYSGIASGDWWVTGIFSNEITAGMIQVGIFLLEIH